MNRLLLVCFVVAPIWAISIYAPKNYFPSEILDSFKEIYKTDVKISEYESYEQMYSNLQLRYDNDYDIVISEAHMIPILINKGLIQKINSNLIENYKNIFTRIAKQSFDLNAEYSVALEYKTLGIAYGNGVNINYWKDLWNYDKIAVIKDAPVMLQVALLASNYSLDTKKEDEIYSAFEKLTKLKIKAFVPNFSPDFIAIMWQGQALKYSNLKFKYPKDGGIFHTTLFTITSNAKHEKMAYKFINYLLDPSVNIKLAVYHDATPSIEQSLIKQNAPHLHYLHLLIPTKEQMDRFELQNNINRVLFIYTKYWNDIKRMFKNIDKQQD